MVNTELRILRVFGPTAAEVSSVLRQARADGCPGLRLLERDGEFAVCVQVSAPNRAMAEQYCEKWVQRLRSKFGDDVFATGETSLAQATLDTLLEKRKLLVAVDETTGRLIGSLLQPLPHSEAVFDFGTESYADPKKQKQIVVPPQLLKKFPGDMVQAAAGRALAAMQAAGADFAAVYMPATVGQCPFVLICDSHGAAACALPPDLNDATIGNQILDLLRRRVLGLRLTDSCIIFRPGRERPLLIVSEAGRERGNTVRFSLRRRTPPTTEPDHTADFEPMLDFDTAEPVAPPTPEPPAAAEATAVGATRHINVGSTHTPPPAVSEPTGTIRFESELEEENEPAPAEVADPLDIRTAGPEAARVARSLRVNRREAPAPEADIVQATEPPRTGGHTIRRSPAPSILDEEVPDFSAELAPEALAAAQAADEADAAAGRTTSAEDFTKAASRLFEENDSADTDEAPLPPRRRGDKPGSEAGSSIRNHSLDVIEKSEKRRRRMVITVLVVLALVIVGSAVALWCFFSNDLGARPAAKSYGTALYDNTAESYLAKGTEKLPGVVGYLGFPGMDGRFVYAADTATAENADSDTKTAAQTRFATPSALNSTAPGNTVLESTDALLTPLTTEEGIKANSGFTLYLPGHIYRFKVLAVYYYDPAERGDGAFDLYGSTDLSSYYDYLSFVAGIQARSLWDTEVEVGDESHFLTLTAPSDEAGVQLCVTGRLIEDGEAEVLNASAITAADDPLLTAVQYQSKNQPMPTVSALLGASIDRYAKQSAAIAANRGSGQAAGDSADSSTDLSQAASEMQQRTDALIASADKLMAGLTDVAGSANATETDLNKGAEGTLPEQTITVDQIANANPTPAPADSTADGDNTENGDATPDAPDNSGDNTNNGGTSAEGETINVTMNGTAQTMDLVRCLAMVAQNELGSSAPAEAYKAQCVATHCWILSQSGYPSVLGAEPGAAALAAAQEVAHVLVTYNDQVCFTPYFASASTGTASAAEVWGNDRAWLQAVDSPYDQQIATNWNTNGNSSGTARFSRQTLQDRIKEVMDIDLSGVDPNSWFTIQSANAYGWVAKIQVGPDAGVGTVSGRWFRENLLARQSVDGRSLRSQCFTVSYNADLDCFIFDVYGYGHGCGMSQWGAIGYARNGWSYRDILTHYFVGTTLTTY